MHLPDPREVGAVSGDATFISFKTSPEHKVVLLGNPIFFRKDFDKATKKTTIYELNSQEGRWCFRINVAINTKEGPQVRILEGGVRLYESIQNLCDEYPLDKHPIIIKRSGEGFDTKYHVIPARMPLEGPLLGAIQKLPLKELDPRSDEKYENSTNTRSDFADAGDEVPF